MSLIPDEIINPKFKVPDEPMEDYADYEEE